MGDAKRVTVEGKALNCVVCGHGEFHQRAGQLNTQVASFFGLDYVLHLQPMPVRALVPEVGGLNCERDRVGVRRPCPCG